MGEMSARIAFKTRFLEDIADTVERETELAQRCAHLDDWECEPWRIQLIYIGGFCIGTLPEHRDVSTLVRRAIGFAELVVTASAPQAKGMFKDLTEKAGWLRDLRVAAENDHMKKIGEAAEHCLINFVENIKQQEWLSTGDIEHAKA